MEKETGQEPTPGGQEPTGNNTAPADAKGDPKVFDEAYVKELRTEAAKYRKEAQDAKAKITAFEQEKMSEAEKLQATAKAAQDAANAARSELQQARAQVAIAQAAATHGVNPAKLAKLVTVEFDADGQPVGVEAAVAAVLNEWPELKPAAAAPTPGATNPQRTAKLTLEQVKKMTPAEINARWDEVQAVLAGG
jgi:hypothetical protein